MATAWKGAGTGAATVTSGGALSPACPATVDAGDILVAHVCWNDTTSSPSTPGTWTLLAGPENIGTTPNGRHWLFGKIADGTEDGAAVSFGTAGGTAKRWGRIYSFSGRVSGTIQQLVMGFVPTSHATDPQPPTVTTTVAGAIAAAFVCQNDDNAIGDWTGESGGDWTEAVAEYTATTGTGVMCQLQTAAMANPGTISGGAFNTANDPAGVIGCEIRPSTPTHSGAVVTPITLTPVVTGTLSRALVSWAVLEIPALAVQSLVLLNRVRSIIRR